jgi:hypothetical protein
MNEFIYVGLDVHLNSITAAVLDGDEQAPQVIKLSGDLMQTRRLFRRLSKKGPVRSTSPSSTEAVISLPFTSHRGNRKRCAA